jgi:hypothetical protein
MTAVSRNEMESMFVEFSLENKKSNVDVAIQIYPVKPIFQSPLRILNC